MATSGDKWRQSLVEKCLEFTLELTKTSSAPISRHKLFSASMDKENMKYRKTYFDNKIPEIVSALAAMDTITVEEKARWMFVTSTSFAELDDENDERKQKMNASLRMLKDDIEDSGIAVYNERSQIIKYTDNGGNLKFEGRHGLRTGKGKRKQAELVSVAPKNGSGCEAFKLIQRASKNLRNRSSRDREASESNEAQPLQDSQENFEPAPKRICTEQIQDVILHKIANIKPEVDDDILFEGIIVKENKPVDPNIHTLGLFNCLKDFLSCVYGICNKEAIALKESITCIIRKLEDNPTFMDLDAHSLHAFFKKSLGRLVLETMKNGQKQLNFSKVLEQLKNSCVSEMSAKLRKMVVKDINEKSNNENLMISGDSLLEEIRRIIEDILMSRTGSLKA